MKNQSVKKTFQKSVSSSNSITCLSSFVYDFNALFRVANHSQTQKALQYIQGLLTLGKGKANMERMEEEIPNSVYRSYQHFITNSDWDYRGIFTKVAKDTSQLLQDNKAISKQPTGLIIDESAHLKKGEKSVAVSKQYAGVVGKVENAQIGVYLSMVNDKRAALIDERLFIPNKWINDKSRCKQAGIPKEELIFRTKPELALEMVDQQIRDGVTFDWVGGDGLYGHNRILREGLERRELFYVLDVHKDEKIFTQCPQFTIPDRTHRRGRPAKKPKPNLDSIRLDRYIKELSKDDWTVEKRIRKTHKGWKELKVHTKTIWVLQEDQQRTTEQTLIITQSVDGTKDTKYSFSNGKVDQHSPNEYAYFQIQRYWVERTFDDAKNELGMSDYQVRKWNGWHHHHALVMMAGLFLLNQRIANEQEIPLMSMSDARIMIIITMFGSQEDIENRLKQMKNRHLKRQAHIDRYYKKNMET